jgi:MFS family permease
MRPWDASFDGTRKSMLSVGIILTGLAPTAAFLLHDLVFQLPDNQHEASLGFFVTVFGLVFVWALGGYLAGRRTRTVPRAISAGLTTSALSVGVLWLTFITLNTLFPDRMSYEPDRRRAFMVSGYPTMREYLVHNIGPGPFPLVLGVAAIVGIAGSLVGEKRQDPGAALGEAGRPAPRDFSA